MDDGVDIGDGGTEEEPAEGHPERGCEQRRRSQTHDQVRDAAARVIAAHGDALERPGE